MKKSYIVDSTCNDMRIDRWIRLVLGKVPQGLIEKNLRSGNIKLNKRKIRSSHKVKTKDKIDLFNISFKENIIQKKIKFEPTKEIIKSNEDQIIDNNENFIVINKSSGISVQGGTKSKKNLVDIFTKSDVFKNTKPYSVHRLDKETSGVMVVAKTEKAYYSLVDQFANRTTGKLYQALICGHPRLRKGEVSLPIGRHPKVRTKMAVVEKGGKPAHTQWNLISLYAEKFALVECRILTGRTHQIRVHMSSLNHPLAGDSTYGYKASKKGGIHFPRIMLHARILSFTHPQSGEELSFSAEVPEDFQEALSALAPL